MEKLREIFTRSWSTEAINMIQENAVICSILDEMTIPSVHILFRYVSSSGIKI